MHLFRAAATEQLREGFETPLELLNPSFNILFVTEILVWLKCPLLGTFNVTCNGIDIKSAAQEILLFISSSASQLCLRALFPFIEQQQS